MLKRVKLVVIGFLMAGFLCYACIGINDANSCARDAAAGSASGGPACGAQKQGGGEPCDITKELGLTPEQQAKIEELKADCEKNGMKCTPECFNKMRAILTDEQAVKLQALITKMKGGAAAGSGCTGKH